MTVLEYDGRIVVIDTGLMFPTPEMLGVDLVLPDFSYLLDNADRIDAIVLTHGHEDHVGALPWVLRELDARPPIYGGPLTIAMARSKIEEHKLKDVPMHDIEPGERVRGGPVRPRDDPRVALDPGRVRRRRHVRPRHRDPDRRLQVRPDAGGRPADRRGAARGARAGGSAAAVRRLDERRPARHRAVGGERRAGAAGGHRARAGPGRRDLVRVQRAPPPAGDRRRDRARPPGRRGGPLDAQEPQHRAPARPRRGARGAARVAQGDRELPRRAARDAHHRQPGRAAVGAAPHGARRAPAT